MKKTINILCIILITSSVFSQTPVSLNDYGHISTPSDKKITEIDPVFLPSKNRYTTRAMINEPINPIYYIKSYLNSIPYLGYTNPIFPDTNVIIDWYMPVGPKPPWLHGICQTFDLAGGYLSGPGAQFDKTVKPFDTNAVTVIDTVLINGQYIRPDTNTVDTAIVSIIAYGHGNYKRIFSLAKPLYVIDDINRDNNPDSVIWRGKIILDSRFKADTLPNGSHKFLVAPNLSISNCRGIIGVSLEYKPGKTYSQSDTIFKNMNFIRAVYATPQGQDTPFPMSIPNDATSGSFSNDSTKYSTTGHDYYLPPVAFDSIDHIYQLYNVTLKVRQNWWMNIKELDSGAKLFQNFPNPTTGNTTIKYSLENQAKVSLEIKDVTGKVVFSQKEKTKNAGVHSFDINLTEFNSGIYFYSLNVNDRLMTKKMVVSN